MGDVKPRLTEETNDKSKIWKLTEINEMSQCRSLRLSETMRITKVCSFLLDYFLGNTDQFSPLPLRWFSYVPILIASLNIKPLKSFSSFLLLVLEFTFVYVKLDCFFPTYTCSCSFQQTLICF